MSLLPKSDVQVNKSTLSLDKARSIMILLYRGRLLVLLATLAALSTYKPYALFQFLRLVITIVNIAMGTILANLVGAAVYMHNILN